MSRSNLDGMPALIQNASREEFGDYQINGMMAAAKSLKENPRELAENLKQALESDETFKEIVSKIEIAGPGFLNLTLKPEFLIQAVNSPPAKTDNTQTVVVDFSSPNLAKEMHVGHLRTTLIGDTMARVFEYQGHKVIRQNHVGDWGTQFGMLIAYLDSVGTSADDLKDLEIFYQKAKKRFDEDPDFAEKSRAYVVALQQDQPKVLEKWRAFIEISMSHCGEIYSDLNVTLRPKDTFGESQYKGTIPSIMETLSEEGLLTESNGALCVFLDEFTDKNGEKQAVIVQKSDGGYLYATTDLAAIRYRAHELEADRILYFVDARQTLHFKQIFALARKAGLCTPDIVLGHISNGAILNKAGKPFKTRDGNTVKLADLIKESRDRAKEIFLAKNEKADISSVEEIANAIGIAAIRYSELSKHRETDYVFDWEKVLSMEGNTAPYLMYMYTRSKSLLIRSELSDSDLPEEPQPEGPIERRLVLKMAQVNEVIDSVSRECLPHLLCLQLYEIATAFARFYEELPILSSPDIDKLRRLAITSKVATKLSDGLDLLGIKVLEKM